MELKVMKRLLAQLVVPAGMAYALLMAAAANAAPYTATQLDTARQLRERAVAGDSPVWVLLESLTSEVGPRLAGSAGDAKAVAWAASQFRNLGFDRVWTQPVTFPRWRRGALRVDIVEPAAQPLVAIALGGSPATPPGGISADVVRFASLEELEQAEAAAVSGRLVFIDRRMARSADGSGYGSAVVGRSRGSLVTAAKGGVGLLLRSIGTDSHRLPHTGMMRVGDGTEPLVPAVALSNPDADQLARLLANGGTVKVHLEVDAGFDGQYTSANVIGEIRGTSAAQEWVLIGGHLDSWDPGTGAVDDGAGVAITMAAAKLLADLPERPKRGIRVVLFANEEQGVYGGKAYAASQSGNLAANLVAAESDFGAGRIYRFSYHVADPALPAIRAIFEALAPLGIADGGRQAHGGADFGQLKALGGAVVDLQQDGTAYFDLHHTADDTLDKVDPAALNQNVAAYAVFAYLAAQSPVPFDSGTLPAEE